MRFSTEVPSFLNPKDIIFNFDRRSITKSKGLVKDDNFEMYNFENEINLIIKTKLIILKNNFYGICISGGITEQSLRSLDKINLKPILLKQVYLQCQ